MLASLQGCSWMIWIIECRAPAYNYIHVVNYCASVCSMPISHLAHISPSQWSGCYIDQGHFRWRLLPAACSITCWASKQSQACSVAWQVHYPLSRKLFAAVNTTCVGNEERKCWRFTALTLDAFVHWKLICTLQSVHCVCGISLSSLWLNSCSF